jgi:tRNA dimethylallyltransferase
MKRQLAIAILGPTASGKTKLAVQIANRLNGEIICMDSTTVYKGLDIGSSKPSAEERSQAPHHLLDISNPNEPFSAFHFVQLTEKTVNDIASRGKLPIIVGGTYFYLRALQFGMYELPNIASEVVDALEKEFCEDDKVNTLKMHDELKKKDHKAAENIHPNDKYRLLRALAILRTTKELPSQLKPTPFSETQKNRLWMKYAVTLSRHALNQAIVNRTEKMIAGGIIDETRKLLEQYPDARCLNSIGYAEVKAFLNKKITEKQLRNEIIEKTRQLAKRQVTWLRSDPEVRFVDFRDQDRICLEVENLTAALNE